MWNEKHDLAHEFPEYRDAIRHLKLSNLHFARLFEEYHEIDHVVVFTGILSMVHGGEFDRKHSTELMYARVGMQGVTLLLLLLAIFLASE